MLINQSNTISSNVGIIIYRLLMNISFPKITLFCQLLYAQPRIFMKSKGHLDGDAQSKYIQKAGPAHPLYLWRQHSACKARTERPKQTQSVLLLLAKAALTARPSRRGQEEKLCGAGSTVQRCGRGAFRFYE